MYKNIFKFILRPYIKSRVSKNPKEFVDAIEKAYIALNSSSITMFGQPFLKSKHLDWFKSDLEQGFKMNELSKKNSSNEKDGWNMIARGFYNFWKDATFSPVPPPPGIASPTTGVTVDSPGDINKLADKIKIAFNQGSVESVLDVLYNTLIEFQSSIRGKYTGLLPNGTVTTIPWTGVFNGGSSVTDDDSPQVIPFGGIGSNIKAIVDFEERHKFELFETGITVKLNGKVHREFTNYLENFVGVGIFPEIISSAVNENLIFSHTHPPELDEVRNIITTPASAFSYADFLAAIAMESPEVRAVDLLFKHIIQPPKSGWREFKKVTGLPDIFTTSIPVFINFETILDIKNVWETAYESKHDELIYRFQMNKNEFLNYVKIYENAMTPDVYDFIFKKHKGWSKSSIFHGESTHAACIAVSNKYKIPYDRVPRTLLKR
jgi:hypothetical protein